MSGPVLDYQIREARWSDCGAMARKLCAGRWPAYDEAGVSPKAALRLLWGESIERRTCLIEGRVVAMWGLVGTILSRSGKAWLALSPEAARHRFVLAREVGRQMAEFAALKEIRTTVARQDATALRWTRFLGFEDDGDEDSHIQVGDSPVFLIPMVLRGR